MTFSTARCLAVAHNALRSPAPLERIVRPEFTGELVAEFVLPLELCKTTNRTRHAQAWSQAKTKSEIRSMMAAQFIQQTRLPQRTAPLPGRPQVLAVRFSRGEPDRYSDWAKAAIDVLCAPDRRVAARLNIIADDRPSCADVHQWREPCPKGEVGFVYLQVRTGAIQ